MRLLPVTIAAVAVAAAEPQSRLSPVLAFEPNVGQTDARAQFVARASGYTVFLTRMGPVLAPRNSHQGVRIRYVDSKAAELAGTSALAGRVNYFLGSGRQFADLPTYARVIQRGIYPGIDVVFHGKTGKIEYDFVIAPGADPGNISVAFEGARHAQLSESGEIEVTTAAGTITQQKPVAWQEIGGGRASVETRYRPKGGGTFAIAVGKYDRTQPLIVDPTLVFYRSIGGSGADQANGVALDSQGNIYVAGQTASLDFPVVGGVQGQLTTAYAYRVDANTGAVTRLNGIQNSITALAADPKSASTVYAATQNGLYKTTDAGATWNAVGNGLPEGAPIYPLAVDPANSQSIYAVAQNFGVFQSADGGANWAAINNGITGVGQSVFQTGGPALVFDPFNTSHILLKTDVAEFQTNDGGETWSPYSFQYDCLAFDPGNQGVAYATNNVNNIESIFKSTDAGNTWTGFSSLPTVCNELMVDPHSSSTLYAGAPEGALKSGLLKSTDGGVTWTALSAPSTYAVAQIAANPVQVNTIYALFYQSLFETSDGGMTFSQLAPGLSVLTFAVSADGSGIYAATQGASNVFVTKFDPSGQNILYSTYVGGSLIDQTAGLSVDAQGDVYVAGQTQSPDFPVTPGALQSSGGQQPGFVTVPGFVFKLNPTGDKLLYSATIDGVTPGAIAIDTEGNAYVTGSSEGGLAVTPGAYWTTAPMCIATGFIGCIPVTDGFVFKINPTGSALVYATYLNQGGLAGSGEFPGDQVGNAIAVDAAGSAYVTGTSEYLDKLSADGSALVYSAAMNAIGRGIALDSSDNAYVTGGYYAYAGGAVIIKFDANGGKLLTSTVRKGLDDYGQGIAVDSSGDVVIAGNTSSPSLQLFSPLQGMFASQTGFLMKFDSTASNLLFATYVGDASRFLLSGLALDSSGRAIISGSTHSQDVISQQSFQDGFISEYDMSNIPSVRLDNVVNNASLNGGPVSVGEIVTVQGAGFGTASNTQLLFDQLAATVLAVTSTQITAIVPYELDGKSSTQVEVQSAGASSNPMWLAVAPTSPGIYTVNGTGTGQAIALNQDGTRNSLSNPAAIGSTVTFYATGVGQTLPPGSESVLHRSAPAAPINSVAAFIGNAYISGPQFGVGPAPGFPADVFTVQAVVPPQTGLGGPVVGIPVQIEIGGVLSQGALPVVGQSTVQIAVQEGQ